MNQFKKILNILFIFLFLSVSPVLAQTESTDRHLEGTVTEIQESGKKTVFDRLVDYQILKIAIANDTDDTFVLVENTDTGLDSLQFQFNHYQVGDKLRLVEQKSSEGPSSYHIEGKIKRNGIFSLIVLFVLVVVAVGQLWGTLSLVGLIASFIVIFKLIIPQIIAGTHPVVAAIMGSIIIVPTTFYISHGWNKKTHIGVITTCIGLILTGLLAHYFIGATHLTGYASEEAGFLQVERHGSIDIKGLLLAGIIIGTLGVLDDVTIGQASTVQQLKAANPNLSKLELFTKGMHVGKDHIASLVNTLVLVYAGSALPLLLLFFGSDNHVTDIIEFELIAEEIVRMMVGSIGIVISAPLSTAIAASIFSRKN